MEPATERIALVLLVMGFTLLAVWGWMLVREILAVRRSAKKSRQQTITEIQGAQIVAEKHLALLQERVMRLEHRLKSQATSGQSVITRHLC